MNGRLKVAAAAAAGMVATVVAGGIAMASMGVGPGHFSGADANGDGKITRAEWLGAANARFVAMDANKDGVLASDELPRHHEGGGHGRRHAADRDDMPPTPAAPAPAAPAPVPAVPAVPAAK